MFGNAGNVIWAVKIHLVCLEKGRKVRQRILDRLSDFSLVCLIVAVYLDLESLLCHAVPSRSVLTPCRRTRL